MTDKIEFYPLGPGVYKPSDADGIVFIDVGEIIRLKGLPDDEQVRFAIFAAYSEQYAQLGDEAILIKSNGVLTAEEAITHAMQDRSNDNGESAETSTDTPEERPED